MRATIRCIVLALSALALTSCKKEEAERSAEPAASVDKAAAIDPALAKAVAAASVVAGGGPAPPSSGGPPPNGVFPPGAADREIVRGAAPKLTVGGTGAEPRFALGSPQPKAGWKASGALQLTLQLDPRQGGLPLDVMVTLEASKPSAPADGGVTPASAVAVTARVTGAKVGVTGVPRELEARFAELKGTRVSYLVAPDGSGSDYKSELPAGANETRDHARVLVDALALVTLPRPTQPLGVGAIWMATSREVVFGLDLVTYRLVRVEEISAESVTLSVGTKRYATSSRFDMDGLRPDDPHELLEFQSKGDGRVTLAIGAPFPQSGELQSLLAAALGEGGKQKGVLQVQSRVGIDFRPK